MENDDRWIQQVEGAILAFLADHREADLDGLRHVLQKAQLQVDEASLNRALANLSRKGRVEVDLEKASRNPQVRLRSPFVPWM